MVWTWQKDEAYFITIHRRHPDALIETTGARHFPLCLIPAPASRLSFFSPSDPNQPFSADEPLWVFPSFSLHKMFLLGQKEVVGQCGEKGTPSVSPVSSDVSSVSRMTMSSFWNGVGRVITPSTFTQRAWASSGSRGGLNDERIYSCQCLCCSSVWKLWEAEVS